MIQVKESQTKDIVNVMVQDKFTKEEINAIPLKIEQTLEQYDKNVSGDSLKGFLEDLKQTS